MAEVAPTVQAVPKDILASASEGVKLFGRWDASEVEVKDISLTDYIAIRDPVYVPVRRSR